MSKLNILLNKHNIMKKLKIILIFFGHFYFPLLYFILYLPIILPKLDSWHKIPMWIPITIIAIYTIILLFIGFISSQIKILIYSISIILIIEFFSFLFTYLRLPCFKKGNMFLENIHLFFFRFILLIITTLFILEMGFLISYFINRQKMQN